MKSRTSFSELTLCRKNIFRFAPIWIIYTVLILLLPSSVSPYAAKDALAYAMSGAIQSFSIINFIYAGIIALALYGDLYKTRMCYALHAMPQRREARFLGNLAVGMLFGLIPNLLLALLWMSSLGSFWFLALYWLLAVTLQFVFFFGVASFAAMLTGNRFAQLLVYAGIHFISLLAYAAVEVIYLPMVTGVVVNSTGFFRLCPVAQMTGYGYFTFLRGRYSYEYMGLGDGWGYLAIVAAVGLSLMALALVLYRKRHLECAGDFLAFAKTKIPACIVMTVCVTLVFAILGQAIDGNSWTELLVGVTIGFFGSLMLLERRVKVFRKATWLSYSILTVVMVLSMTAIQNDWLGIESWIPRAEKVESVTLSNDYNGSYYYDTVNRMEVTLTQEEDIAKIIQAHADILSRLNVSTGKTHRVTLTYKMKSGRTVTRSYLAPASGENYRIVQAFLYSPGQIMGTTGLTWENYLDGIQYVHWDCNSLPPQLYAQLLEAMLEDCRDGHVLLQPRSDKYEYLELQSLDADGNILTRVLYVEQEAEKTMALLRSPEYILCYTDWESYLAGIDSVTACGTALKKDQYRDLLEAIRADIRNGADTGYGEIFITVNFRISGVLYHRELTLDKYAANTVAWLRENGLY